MIENVLEPIAQYAARSLDDEILMSSSSGGVFTELAKVVLRRKGVVCAAAWNKSNTVEHRFANTARDLSDMRGSKYTTSDLSGAYLELKRYLSSGKDVLFVGTPCQIAAIKRFSGNATNLYLCAIMCHSNVPADIWSKYVSELENKVGSRLSSVSFRDKRNGWLKSTMCIHFEDASKDIVEPMCNNFFIRLFFSGYATKSSCFDCKFRAGRSGADIVIGDFWGIEKVLNNFDYERGASSVLVYTARGKSLFDSASVYKTPVAFEQITAGNPNYLASPTVDRIKRDRFQRAYKFKSMASAIRYAEWGPLPVEITLKCYFKCRCFVGALLRRAGIK